MTIDELFDWLSKPTDSDPTNPNNYLEIHDLFLGQSRDFQGGGWTLALAEYYTPNTKGALVVDLPPEEWRMLQILPVPSRLNTASDGSAIGIPTNGQLLLWTAWSRGLSPRAFVGSLDGTSDLKLILRFEPIRFHIRADRPFEVSTLDRSRQVQASFPACSSVDEVCLKLSSAYASFSVVVNDALRAVPIKLPELHNVTFAGILDEMAWRLQAVWDWFDTSDASTDGTIAEVIVVPVGPAVELEYRMPCQLP